LVREIIFLRLSKKNPAHGRRCAKHLLKIVDENSSAAKNDVGKF